MSTIEHSSGNSAAHPLAQVQCSEHKGVRLVSVSGELDISNVGMLQGATLDLPNDGLGIVLDLREASYIDSATMGVLFSLQHSLRRRGQALRVVCAANSSACRVLQLSGFDASIVCESDSDAMREIRREISPSE